MKHLLWLFLATSLAARAAAQSNVPVRLALIAESPEASAASDLLTVELTKNPQVTLLERNEIDRVYREQGLSAANRDYLKLGQVLGADGVLLLTAIAETNHPAGQTNGAEAGGSVLRVQLIAVKPGVLLTSERFPSPQDLSIWSSAVAKQLEPLLPKLSVLVKDAVPVSVVNFRSAIQSPETKEVERQLTTLAIERLSREHQLMVLERTKMQLLAEEKDLKGLNDSAFWNGSYLLEGTIDRDGYSPGKITISARLVPPRGGAPVALEVSGSRTNFPEAIEQLAQKIRESLKLADTTPPWNPADEAQKYYEEAQWALKWGLYEQAQSASDSAWALGKQDMDCALARLTAYIRPIPAIDPQWGTRHIMHLAHPLPAIIETNRPDPAEIDRVLHVLQLYEQFGRTLSTNEPQQDSPYYTTGLLALEKATGVLRHFYVHPESQAAVQDKLADLRAATRSVAAWIDRSPSVRKTYWVEGRIPDSEELYRDFSDDNSKYRDLDLMRNFYQSELKWGRFWQEKPEDSVAEYRSLMQGPMFTAIQTDLWNRREKNLLAWNAADLTRVPALWQGFVAELNASTNAFLQMEFRTAEFTDALINRKNANEDVVISTNMTRDEISKALETIYAERDKKMESACTNLFDFIFSHYDEMVTGREPMLSVGLGMEGLFSQEGESFPSLENLRQRYRTICAPKIAALHADYTNRFSDRLIELQNAETFNEQRNYLAKFTPYNSDAFYQLFSSKNFSQAQAAELKPLLAAYQSNLLAQANANTSPTNGFVKSKARMDVNSMATLGRRLDKILTPKPPALNQPAITASTTTPRPPPRPSVAAPKPPAPTPSSTPTNALIARKFLAFPTNGLPAKKIVSLVVFSHRMRDDKLLLNLQYLDWWIERWVNEDGGTNTQQFHINREAGAVLDSDGAWTVTPFPHTNDSMIGSDFMMGTIGVANVTGPDLYVEMFHDAIYVSDPDAIRHYDSRANKWNELPFPGQERAQLYVVNDHLYAASAEGIWEILDDGQSAHILASVRRQPAVSQLDSRGTLGKPVLFSGKDHALSVALKGEVLAWDGSDWKSVLTVKDAQVAINSQGTIFFRALQSGEPRELWRLSPNEKQAALCLRDDRTTPGGRYNRRPPQRGASDSAPLWVSPRGTGIALNPLTLDGSTVYVLSVPSSTSPTWNSGTARNGRRIEANLVCLLPDSREPVTIPIEFDSNAGPVTVANAGPSRGAGLWVESSSTDLLIGASGLPGVWLLPKSEIQGEIKRELAVRPPDETKVAEEGKKTVRAKYDSNHNGEIDPKEREAAINDPAFLESEMDKIDVNGNGQLDPEDLRYFDANQNGILDSPEMAGIHAFQHILAVKGLKDFDADENGRLDTQEYWAFTRNKRPSTFGHQAMQFMPSKSDVERIEHYLEGATEDTLEETLRRAIPGWMPMRSGPGLPSAMILKDEIQLFWSRQKGSATSQKPQAPR